MMWLVKCDKPQEHVNPVFHGKCTHLLMCIHSLETHHSLEEMDMLHCRWSFDELLGQFHLLWCLAAKRSKFSCKLSLVRKLKQLCPCINFRCQLKQSNSTKTNCLVKRIQEQSRISIIVIENRQNLRLVYLPKGTMLGLHPPRPFNASRDQRPENSWKFANESKTHICR